MSAVPVGAELGLTAILAADTPPYCAWGSGLAEFGAQAAIEAQSPYYKLLIGRVLGYELENIRAHVEVCGVVEEGALRISYTCILYTPCTHPSLTHIIHTYHTYHSHIAYTHPHPVPTPSNLHPFAGRRGGT